MPNDFFTLEKHRNTQYQLCTFFNAVDLAAVRGSCRQMREVASDSTLPGSIDILLSATRANITTLSKLYTDQYTQSNFSDDNTLLKKMASIYHSIRSCTGSEQLRSYLGQKGHVEPMLILTCPFLFWEFASKDTTQSNLSQIMICSDSLKQFFVTNKGCFISTFNALFDDPARSSGKSTDTMQLHNGTVIRIESESHGEKMFNRLCAHAAQSQIRLGC